MRYSLPGVDAPVLTPAQYLRVMEGIPAAIFPNRATTMTMAHFWAISLIRCMAYLCSVGDRAGPNVSGRPGETKGGGGPLGQNAHICLLCSSYGNQALP